MIDTTAIDWQTTAARQWEATACDRYRLLVWFDANGWHWRVSVVGAVANAASATVTVSGDGIDLQTSQWIAMGAWVWLRRAMEVKS